MNANAPYVRYVLHVCPSDGGIYSLPLLGSCVQAGAELGIIGPCSLCGYPWVEHRCSATGQASWLPVERKAPPPWFPVLKAVVSASCPACGAVIDMANTIANNPLATETERQAAISFRNGALVFGTGLLALGIIARFDRSAATLRQ